MDIVHKTLMELANRFDMDMDQEVYRSLDRLPKIVDLDFKNEIIEGGVLFLDLYLREKVGQGEIRAICNQYISAYKTQTNEINDDLEFILQFIKDLKVLVMEGGNVNQVIRVGQTIRRQCGPNSYSEELLKYLEKKGFDKAPKYLGRDELGREMLTFMEGEVSGQNYPNKPFYMWSEEALVETAKLLKSFHDASIGFTSNASPELTYPDVDKHQVICHNDFAPYNMVFMDGLPCGVFDFDMASPGPRLWDIAYALYTFIPIASFQPDYDQGMIVTYDDSYEALRVKRIKLFFQVYGMDIPPDLKEWVIKRVKKLYETIEIKASQGDVAFMDMVKDGHLEHYQGEIDFLKKYFPCV